MNPFARGSVNHLVRQAGLTMRKARGLQTPPRLLARRPQPCAKPCTLRISWGPSSARRSSSRPPRSRPTRAPKFGRSCPLARYRAAHRYKTQGTSRQAGNRTNPTARRTPFAIPLSDPKRAGAALLVTRYTSPSVSESSSRCARATATPAAKHAASRLAKQP